MGMQGNGSKIHPLNVEEFFKRTISYMEHEGGYVAEKKNFPPFLRKEKKHEITKNIQQKAYKDKNQDAVYKIIFREKLPDLASFLAMDKISILHNKIDKFKKTLRIADLILAYFQTASILLHH